LFDRGVHADAGTVVAAVGQRGHHDPSLTTAQRYRRPGILGEVTGGLGAAAVTITSAYLATGSRLVVAADDLAAAKAVLSLGHAWPHATPAGGSMSSHVCGGEILPCANAVLSRMQPVSS
jgi:hypothetical protein